MSEPPRLPARADYGHGVYRRRIALQADGEVVRGELADDFHHFAVEVRHRAGRVEAVRGEDVRVPWTTCPGAVLPLRRMAGAAVTRDLNALLAHTPARDQCTHLHDLACLAITHAARAEKGRAASRVYDVALPDRRRGETRATLARDGDPALEWRIEGTRIVDATPSAFAGQPLSGRRFRAVLAAEPDPDRAEAAWILQRAVFVGTGRRHDFEAMADATTFAPVVGAACHSFAPERVETALRVHGTVRDFSDAPERIFDRE